MRRCILQTVLLVLVFTGSASACPFCEGGPSGTNAVKEAIFGDGFWFHLLAVTSPFLLVVLIAAVVLLVPAPKFPMQGAVDGKPR